MSYFDIALILCWVESKGKKLMLSYCLRRFMRLIRDSQKSRHFTNWKCQYYQLSCKCHNCVGKGVFQILLIYQCFFHSWKWLVLQNLEYLFKIYSGKKSFLLCLWKENKYTNMLVLLTALFPQFLTFHSFVSLWKFHWKIKEFKMKLVEIGKCENKNKKKMKYFGIKLFNHFKIAFHFCLFSAYGITHCQVGCSGTHKKKAE